MSRQTILVADDESAVRKYIGAILRSRGFDVIEAVDGLDATEKLQARGAEVALLLTDVRMPRMDGPALARFTVENYPEVPVIYISGFPLQSEEPEGRDPLKPCAFLSKPFTSRR